MKKYIIKISLITIIIFSCSIYLHFLNPNSIYKKKIVKIDQNIQYKVVKVIDGDTFEISNDKKINIVRMLGIDTPETVDPRKGIQCFGKKASEKTKELLWGQYILLNTDSSQGDTDKYGRILAYVYTSNLFVNRYLLEYGYAREYKYKKDYEKRKEFREIETIAKKKEIGLWGSECNKKNAI